MKDEYRFTDKHEFLDKLKDLVDAGVPRDSITTWTPVPVEEVDEMTGKGPSWLKAFSYAGAFTGTLTGLALTVYTVLRYPLPVSGKPLVTLLPFGVIMFELTILIGSVVSLLGFLLLAGAPYLPQILDPISYGNEFVIVVDHD